jgi:hypothetical protein
MKTSLAITSLLPQKDSPAETMVLPFRSSSKKARSGAFGDNMKLPLHRWFRYSAGFSAEWAQTVIQETVGRDGVVLDPFAGSGTTLIAAQRAGVASVGLESHPFVSRVALAKLCWDIDAEQFLKAADLLLEQAKKVKSPRKPNVPVGLLAKCYSEEALVDLLALRQAYEEAGFETDKIRQLLWLLITSILRECSFVGTAQWQYVLPNKKKARTKTPFAAYTAKARDFYNDIRFAQENLQGKATLITADARDYPGLEYKNYFDMIVASPPYPNNYDYADATRLEMSFWGEVSSWGELHEAVRNKLICSCSQHSAAEKMNLNGLLNNPLLKPICNELEVVCRQLETIRETKGGKKTYHTMIAAYFSDLAQIWKNLRPMMKSGSTIHFVIGDSAPYGVYVPCDKWLAELALAAGFKDPQFIKLRDRNTKWKNRKHTVPLKEGILTVRG